MHPRGYPSLEARDQESQNRATNDAAAEYHRQTSADDGPPFLRHERNGQTNDRYSTFTQNHIAELRHPTIYVQMG